MKRGFFKTTALALTLIFILFSMASCVTVQNESGTGSTTAAKATDPVATTGSKEPVYVEWWRNNQQGITWEKDGPVSKWLIERTGVGMYMPLVIWEGGNGYYTRFQTRVATGDLPDIFIPLKGIESTLIEDGMIWDLTDYLPKYCPNIWNLISQEVWDIVAASDPTGNNRIYYIPNVQNGNYYGSFIRKDWLDDAGLGIPTNQAEYVEALRAFKAMGSDVYPTIGREFGRWMDHLFYMYDVAMFEGYPAFDLYNGEVTYSAVTPNMKEALGFIRGLYEEKLLDNETFLNKANDLWEKVRSDKVGSWFHIPHGLSGMALNDILKINEKADVVVLPRIAAPGYDGHITVQQIWGPMHAFGKNDEETFIAALQMMNWLSADENYEEQLYGVEGLHYEMKDGKKVMIQDIDVNTVEKKVSCRPTGIEDHIYLNKLAFDQNAENPLMQKAISQNIRALEESQKDRHRGMVQDGMPAAVYEGFPDISSHKLYQEYMTKIIIGELPLSAFDEFVERWYSSGGKEVTERVSDWYNKIK